MIYDLFGLTKTKKMARANVFCSLLSVRKSGF